MHPRSPHRVRSKEKKAGVATEKIVPVVRRFIISFTNHPSYTSPAALPEPTYSLGSLSSCGNTIWSQNIFHQLQYSVVRSEDVELYGGQMLV